MSATLLVEIVTEELPPKALKSLAEAFAEGIVSGLGRRGLLGEGSNTIPYSTPRRLAATITCVLPRSQDQPFRQKLLPVSVAYDAQGQPTPALAKKLAALGLADAGALTRENDGKTESLYYAGTKPSMPLTAGLQEVLEETIAGLPIPKLMSYQRADGATVKFVRPAHRLIALHGAEIVPVNALGLTAGRTTSGHRFLGRGDIELASAEAYAPALAAEGKVVASFSERRAKIVGGLEIAAPGASIIMPDALIDEVTALVEWPMVYVGGFDRAFVAVPQECLILTMQRNQRYFALADAQGALQNRFLMVSNIATSDPTEIIRGNERVLRARLADAKFFYDQDRKIKLEARVPRLASVVYHSKLGSQLERVERLRAIALFVAGKTGADPELADRAAYLAKADLLTEMVGEFPELQGLMGRYYALHDGEPKEVANAIGTQYLVRQNETEWAENLTGAVLMTADRIETLVGIYGIGLIPTGDKDPYGLRRAALGLIGAFEAFGAMAKALRTTLQLELHSLLEFAASTFPAGRLSPTVVPELEDFVFERYRHQLAVVCKREIVDSVVDRRPPLNEVPARVHAVSEFMRLPEAEALASANKRIGNILRKSETEAAAAVDRSLLADGAENDLYASIQKLLPVVRGHVEQGNYTDALRALASARSPVDRFFDDVLVMADDPAVRANRLALLRALAHAMNQVADISKLAI